MPHETLKHLRMFISYRLCYREGSPSTPGPSPCVGARGADRLLTESIAVRASAPPFLTRSVCFRG